MKKSINRVNTELAEMTEPGTLKDTSKLRSDECSCSHAGSQIIIIIVVQQNQNVINLPLQTSEETVFLF